jgi:hypothetical protein
VLLPQKTTRTLAMSAEQAEHIVSAYNFPVLRIILNIEISKRWQRLGHYGGLPPGKHTAYRKRDLSKLCLAGELLI